MHAHMCMGQISVVGEVERRFLLGKPWASQQIYTARNRQLLGCLSATLPQYVVWHAPAGFYVAL